MVYFLNFRISPNFKEILNELSIALGFLLQYGDFTTMHIDLPQDNYNLLFHAVYVKLSFV